VEEKIQYRNKQVTINKQTDQK